MGIELNYCLKQLNIKCAIDFGVTVLTCFLFLFFVKAKGLTSFDIYTFIALALLINVVSQYFTKQWVTKIIKRTVTKHSKSISSTTEEVLESVNRQIQKYESVNSNNKTLSNLIDKLKTISEDSLLMSKNTEKQIGQSMTFSQKEHDFISANAEKMLVLRQKIQMIAELILELSEHSQQIGNTISVVDDIAEQTNMLALNAAVEAARAAVMATEEGTKEIESVVKDINTLSSDSETLLVLIKDVLESLEVINKNAQKQNEIVEKLTAIDEKMVESSSDFLMFLNNHAEKISELNKISYNVTSSTEIN